MHPPHRHERPSHTPPSAPPIHPSSTAGPRHLPRACLGRSNPHRRISLRFRPTRFLSTVAAVVSGPHPSARAPRRHTKNALRFAIHAGEGRGGAGAYRRASTAGDGKRARRRPAGRARAARKATRASSSSVGTAGRTVPRARTPESRLVADIDQRSQGLGAQLVGDQSSRETALGFQQRPKESDGCSPIPVRLREDVQDVTVPHPVPWTHICAMPPGTAHTPRAPRSACDTQASRDARSGCTAPRSRPRRRGRPRGSERFGRGSLAP